jgi:hypothetical protein
VEGRQKKLSVSLTAESAKEAQRKRGRNLTAENEKQGEN